MTRNNPSTPPTSASLAVLQFILSACGQIAGKAKEVFGTVTSPDKRTLWGNHLPLAADVSADMIELDPSFFTWFSRTPEWLRVTTLEIKLLTEIVSYVSALLTFLTTLLSVRRSELSIAMTELQGGVDGIKACKLIPEERVTRMTELAQPLEDIMTKRRDAILSKRRATQEKGKKVKALTDQVQGMGGAPAVILPRKGRRPRKTKR